MKGIRPLNEFIQLYRDHLIALGKSWDPLRASLHDVLEFHQVIGEEKDLRKVDRRQVQRHVAIIRKKYGIDPVKRKQESVRAFYEFLQQEKLVAVNPFADLTPKCVFRSIRPGVPEHSGRLFRSLRPGSERSDAGVFLLA
jgi:site-specific recombinase XerD